MKAEPGDSKFTQDSEWVSSVAGEEVTKEEVVERGQRESRWSEPDSRSTLRLNKREDEQHRKLFIGGLKYETNGEGLHQFYSQWGDITDHVVVTDSMTKKSRGFGFVVYSDVSMVDEAMAHRPHTIDGKTVQPKRAQPRDMKGPEANLSVTKLYVSGIREDHTEEMLRDHFSVYGEIKSVDLLKDPNGKPRGFAFINFTDYDPVDKCVLERHHMINGKRCDVKKGLTKEEMRKLQQKEREKQERDGRTRGSFGGGMGRGGGGPGGYGGGPGSYGGGGGGGGWGGGGGYNSGGGWGDGGGQGHWGAQGQWNQGPPQSQAWGPPAQGPQGGGYGGSGGYGGGYGDGGAGMGGYSQPQQPQGYGGGYGGGGAPQGGGVGGGYGGGGAGGGAAAGGYSNYNQGAVQGGGGGAWGGGGGQGAGGGGYGRGQGGAW